ncbi:DMT family transporter [Streptomyces sp. SID3343]|uniref:DMT family transporter n=1 Tax=Streptomyces sp. SID3343 TaxID=2690260 RepID=UPI00136DA105|nr:DMT family transporter [Streptomyces sp. SID3343]MYV97451.1 EamA family transporter [Streptomyces sp. SID3343]
MTIQDSATRPPSIALGGTALAAVAVFSFSLSFPATVWVLEGFGPWTAAGLRGVLAALLAGGCLLVGRVPLPARADRLGLSVVALGCAVGFPLLTTLALQTSSAAHSAVVIGLLPLATTVFSVVRTGERPSRGFWCASTAGAAVVLGFTVVQSGGGIGLADGYLFAALLVCAAGYAEGGRLARHLPGWQVIAWGLVAALPITGATTILALGAEPIHVNAHGVIGLFYLAVVSQFGGFVLWYRGMAAIGVPAASQLQLAQPLLTLVWAVSILDERLSPAMPVAALGVLASIVVTQRTRS